MNPKISIVITVFNKEQYIEHVVNSYLRQNEKSIELILVDDNSSDDSIQIMENLINEHSNIILIKNDENLGPSIRLNQGFKVASGSYVLFADGDDIIVPNVIRELLDLMEKYDADYLKAPYGGRIFKNVEEINFSTNITNAFHIKEIVDNPLSYVIQERLIGMGGLLIKNEFPSEFVGCDEDVFVQDMSIHLEIGKYAKRLLLLSDSFLFGFIDNSDSLTRRLKHQAHYDLILSYKNFYDKNKDILQDLDIVSMVKRSSTAMWKSHKKNYGLGLRYLYYHYLLYLKGRFIYYNYPLEFFESLLKTFDIFQNIRKTNMQLVKDKNKYI